MNFTARGEFISKSEPEPYKALEWLTVPGATQQGLPSGKVALFFFCHVFEDVDGLSFVLFCRDVREELRIKKTVDAWINTLSKEIQVSWTERFSLSFYLQMQSGVSAQSVTVLCSLKYCFKRENIYIIISAFWAEVCYCFAKESHVWLFTWQTINQTKTHNKMFCIF